MRAAKVTGTISASFLAIVLVGSVALTALNSASGAPSGARPWTLEALGLAWMLGLLAAFATGCLFFVAWVAEAIAPVEVEREARGSLSAAEGRETPAGAATGDSPVPLATVAKMRGA